MTARPDPVIELAAILHAEKIGCGQIGFAPDGVCTTAVHLTDASKLLPRAVTLDRIAPDGLREALVDGMTREITDRTAYYAALLAEHPDRFVAVLMDHAGREP